MKQLLVISFLYITIYAAADSITCLQQYPEIVAGYPYPLTFQYTNCYSAEVQFQDERVQFMNLSGPSCASTDYLLTVPSIYQGQWFNLTMNCPSTAGICLSMKISELGDISTSVTSVGLRQNCTGPASASLPASSPSTGDSTGANTQIQPSATSQGLSGSAGPQPATPTSAIGMSPSSVVPGTPSSADMPIAGSTGGTNLASSGQGSSTVASLSSGAAQNTMSGTSAAMLPSSTQMASSPNSNTQTSPAQGAMPDASGTGSQPQGASNTASGPSPTSAPGGNCTCPARAKE